MRMLLALAGTLVASVTATQSLVTQPAGVAEDPAASTVPGASLGGQLPALIWTDVDADGLDDLLSLSGGSLGLHHNDGAGGLVDATLAYGLAQVSGIAAAGFVDFDADGFQDLFLISAPGRGQLLRNESGLAFLDVTQVSGLEAEGPIVQAEWRDVDGNAQLDLVLWTSSGVRVNRNLDGRFSAEALDLPVLPIPGDRTSRGWIGEFEGDEGAAGGAAQPEAPSLGGAGSGGGWIASGSQVGVPGVLVPDRPSMSGIPLNCSTKLLDQQTQTCVVASSAPALGKLYPLSVNLNVNSAGRVGIGTSAPLAKLHVAPGNQTGIWSSGSSYAGRFDTTSATLPALRADGAVAGFFDGKLNVGYNFVNDIARVALGIDGDSAGLIEAFASSGNRTVLIQGTELSNDGAQVDLATAAGTETITFDAEESGLGAAAVMRMLNGTTTVRIDAEEAAGNGAEIALANANGDDTIVLDANTSTGGGQFSMHMVNGTKTVEIVSEESGFNGGQIEMWNALGNRTVQLDANTQATGGSILYLYDLNGSPTVEIEADESLGDGGQIALRKVDGTATIVLDADHNGDGRIITEVLEITGGADLVEGFETGDVDCPPGSVVAIDPHNPGQLTLASSPYDKRVAGVVSGAGDVRPGLHLGQSGVADGDTKVALTGRVYVRCSDENGPIEPGDRLTTSSTPGLAMRATDVDRAPGAVIGKAMGRLEGDSGLVLVLVNLQ